MDAAKTAAFTTITEKPAKVKENKMLFSRKILLLPPRKFAILTLKVLPPIRRHVFRDAQCAARLLLDGWCIGRRRMKVYSESPAAGQRTLIPWGKGAKTDENQ